MELKKNNDKLHNQLKKTDDNEKQKLIESKLDQTLVQQDALKEELEFTKNQFGQVQAECTEATIRLKSQQVQNDKLVKVVDQLNERLKQYQDIENK